MEERRAAEVQMHVVPGFYETKDTIRQTLKSGANPIMAALVKTYKELLRIAMVDKASSNSSPEQLLSEFVKEVRPSEELDKLTLFIDERTGARFCECHVRASVLIDLGATDVPVDPEEQGDYRANREIEENSVAFQKMKEDAKLKRGWSEVVLSSLINIFCENVVGLRKRHPLSRQGVALFDSRKAQTVSITSYARGVPDRKESQI